MKPIAPVAIQGNEAPASYEDFSAMLESLLAPVQGREIQLLLDITNMRLKRYLVDFAGEHSLAHFYAPFNSAVQPTLQIAFINAAAAKSFILTPYQGLERRPSVILLTTHGSLP